MSVVKKEEVRGCYSDERVICFDCMTDEDWKNQDDLIFESDIQRNDDEFYYCDECNELL